MATAKTQKLKTYKPAPQEDLDELELLAGRRVYVLAVKNPITGKIFDENGNRRNDPEYPPRRNLLTRCGILWDGSDLKINKETGVRISGQPKGKRLLRYYDGCTSLFVDEQPTDKDTIDALVKSTRELYFINGYLPIYGYDMMLTQYADMCSYNENSKYRIPTYEVIFKLLDVEKDRELLSDEMDEMIEAMNNAVSASDKNMLVHARFLGVPEVDYKSGNKLSLSAIRTEYRKVAKNESKRFNETFNDKTIHIQSWIDEAMKNGGINTSLFPHMAVWGDTGGEICDISGLKSKDAILNKLIEFSQSPAGADFLQQLESLYKG